MNRKCRLRAVAVAVACAVHATQSSAGPPSGGSLRARLGMSLAEELLASDVKEDRVRGLERLDATATEPAVARLVAALDPGGSAKSAEERLTAVRALSHYTNELTVRRALARVVGGHAGPSSTEERTALDELGENTAALALARAGTADALTALGRALERPGNAAAAAHQGLVAYPPRNLSAVLDAAQVSTLELAATLDELRDPRGADTLRRLVRTGSPETRARAALALTRLADHETVELADHWLTDASPALRVAAAQILTLSGEKNAAQAVVLLLRDPATVAEGVRLALHAPNPELVPELATLAARASGAPLEDLVNAIANAGGAAAPAALASILPDPERGASAALALARVPTRKSEQVLAGALNAGATRRVAARAGTVRWLVLGARVPGLDAALAAMTASADPVDVAVGREGMAALDLRRIGATLGDAKHPEAWSDVAGLALLAPTALTTTIAGSLADVNDDVTRAALALSLVLPAAEARAPISALTAFIDAKSVAAPLAARALAARDDAGLAPVVDALVTSDDAELRAHAALGFGTNPAADAAGRLERAYRFETDRAVRAAIVRGMSLRTGPARERTLAVAAALDPDPDVRALAREARAGAKLTPVTTGSSVVATAVGVPSGARGVCAIRTPDGVLLPAAFGPDGVAIVAGLPAGSTPELDSIQVSTAVNVAPEPLPEDARHRGASGNPKSDGTGPGERGR